MLKEPDATYFKPGWVADYYQKHVSSKGKTSGAADGVTRRK